MRIFRYVSLIALLVFVSTAPAQQSREEMLKRVEVDPEDSAAREKLVDSYVKQADAEFAKGKKKTAFESYKKAMKISPNHPRASARYWELKDQQLTDSNAGTKPAKKTVKAGNTRGHQTDGRTGSVRTGQTPATPDTGLTARDRKNMERLLELEQRVFEKLEGFQKNSEESLRLQGEMRDSIRQSRGGTSDSSALYILGLITMTVILAAFGFAFFVSRDRKIENPFLMPPPQPLALPAPAGLPAKGALLALPVDLRKLLAETAEAQWLAGNFSDSTFGQIAEQLSQDIETSIAKKARRLLDTHFGDKAARDFIRRKSPAGSVTPGGDDTAFLDVLPMETFRLIGNLIDVKTQRPGHNEAVAKLSVLIAEKLSLPPEQVDIIRAGAYIHDMGMLEFEEDFFVRAEIFTHADLDYLREHPAKGVTMLTMNNLPQKVRDIVMCHHERADGSGYPASLRGIDIPIEAQIVGCAESFVAMTNYRNYKKTVDAGAALHILRHSPGSLFDADVIGALDTLVREKKISATQPTATKILAGITSAHD